MSFNLTFDVEVILIVFTTPWVESFDKCISEEGLRVKLDLINKVRAEAHLQAFRYKRAMARFYDCEVRLWKVRIEDYRGQLVVDAEPSPFLFKPCGFIPVDKAHHKKLKVKLEQRKG
ncbi:hypothetical protein B296_00036458 [Ensete ventricosum]|uniref:Uncharacterized protein n=1 Tax=Ensete ventricosum TaxID=4639 RepID=A0A427A2F0_ENSVE|nr:hypothetical protein B296_00036458 [Ensete ventricosum]